MSQSALLMLGARRDQMFPTMTQDDIDRLRRFGEAKFYETGERIVRAGHVAPGLIVILSGKVEVIIGDHDIGVEPSLHRRVSRQCGTSYNRPQLP